MSVDAVEREAIEGQGGKQVVPDATRYADGSKLGNPYINPCPKQP